MNSDEILQLIATRDYIAADEALLTRLQADPQDVEALFLRANVLYSTEYYEDAANHNATALRLIDNAAPAAAPLLLQAADIALIRGDADTALQLLRQANILVPDDITIMRRLYREWRIRDDGRAAALFETLLRRVQELSANRVAPIFYGLACDRAAFADLEIADNLLDRAQQQATSQNERTLYKGERVGLALNAGRNRPDTLIGSFMAGLPPAQRNEAKSLLESSTLPAVSKGGATTIVVTTNLTKKLVVNKAKAPPRDTLLRETLESLQKYLKPSANDPIVIYYDALADPNDAEHLAYLQALQSLATVFKAELRVQTANGLRRNYIDAVVKTNTPYFMLLEHDWLFTDQVPTLEKLTDTLQRHDFIHLLRLNKRPNVAVRDDTILRRDLRVTTAPVLQTINFSNNPHVARTAKLQRDIIPLVAPNARHDAIGLGSGGVEETVIIYLATLQRRYGFSLAQRWGGAYVYGAENDPARIIHTGI